ncbi:hypothetical protein EHS39_33170 [Ensifer sp. MPMI2T]|nr:hypothetical protein EHS39_33170 [Ensifer sp. MPMI2T]
MANAITYSTFDRWASCSSLSPAGLRTGRCGTAKAPALTGALKLSSAIWRLSLHVSLNRSRFKDKNMQQLKVIQRPLRV